MSNLFLSLLLFAVASVPFTILWFMRHSRRDGWMYLLGSICILLITASILVWAPTAYNALGGVTFIPASPSKGDFDSQTYSGFLQILFGVPVAVAGSLYAIFLARQSERQSSQFNAYEIRKNFRDRLEKRTMVLGQLAKSLRDLNNTAFILLARVESAIAALPLSDDGRGTAAVRIAKESSHLDEGLQTLREALANYRDATIAVDEAGILLDTASRGPLGTIGWQFYGREAPGPATAARLPVASEAPPHARTQASPDASLTSASAADAVSQELVDSLLDRDYQAGADRLLIRAHQLSAANIVRTRLERMVHFLVRWSERADLREGGSNVRDFLIGNLATADIDGYSDHVGFRFIGPALIRADQAVDRLDRWKLRSSIDFGSAILIDAYLSLPSKEQSETEVFKWEEWKTFLDKEVDPAERKTIRNLIRDREQYFPKSFCKEVAKIQSNYDYYKEADDRARASRSASVRLEHFALFHHMPPLWMQRAYDDLASKVLGDTPPLQDELVSHVGTLAVAILVLQLSGTRTSSMAAIHCLLQSMEGAVELHFLQLGTMGFADWRRCMLIKWIQQTDATPRDDICKQLESQLAITSDAVHVAQLHLDLVDCYLALERKSEAAFHFEQARTLIYSHTPVALAAASWFAPYEFEDTASWLSPQVVLFSLWICGYLMKQSGEYYFNKFGVSEMEVSLPIGFLPLLWRGMAKRGLIQLAPGKDARLKVETGENYFGVLIEPEQGDWTWDPQVLTGELGRLWAEARDSNSNFVDFIYDSHS